MAAALYAFDPYLVRQSGSPVEITLCTTLLAAAVWLYARGDSPRHAAATGFLLGAAALTRFSLLPVAAGAHGFWLWRRQWRQAAVFTLAVASRSAYGCCGRTLNGAVVLTRRDQPVRVDQRYASQIVPVRNTDLSCRGRSRPSSATSTQPE
jgi:hypothetical protein